MTPRNGDGADCDVLILGAGNVGLTLALLLLQQQIEVSVIDRRPPADWQVPAGFDPRVYALNAAARSVLERLGVWQRLDPDRIGVIAAMEVNGDRGGRLHFRSAGAPLAHVIEDGALQTALIAALRERQGPDWCIAAEPLAVRPGTQSITLECAGLAPRSARLLAGADGARSWLRDTLGWPSTSHDYHQQGVVVNFACERPHDEVARQWFLDGEVIALLPLSGRHVSLVWSAQQDHARALLDGAPGHCAAALEERIGAPLGALREVSAVRAFPLRLTQVPQTSGQRAVLLGDAAHGVHPLAGQGLNLGIADAACLADVLATRGLGPDIGDRSLLRRYARRRAGPVQAMQWTTDGLLRLFAWRDPMLSHLRNAGLDLVDRAPLFKGLLAAAAAGTSGIPE